MNIRTSAASSVYLLLIYLLGRKSDLFPFSSLHISSLSRSLYLISISKRLFFKKKINKMFIVSDYVIRYKKYCDVNKNLAWNMSIKTKPHKRPPQVPIFVSGVGVYFSAVYMFSVSFFLLHASYLLQLNESTPPHVFSFLVVFVFFFHL